MKGYDQNSMFLEVRLFFYASKVLIKKMFFIFVTVELLKLHKLNTTLYYGKDYINHRSPIWKWRA